MPITLKNKGIALLFSILMLSMVFTASLAIFQIIFTGLKLSESVRDSQLAYYAADSAVECALYVDLERERFGKTSSPNSSLMDCDGYVDGKVGKLPGEPWTSGAVFTINYDNDSCANVTVDKRIKTIIKAQGFNSCDLKAPRRVNRSLEVKY